MIDDLDALGNYDISEVKNHSSSNGYSARPNQPQQQNTQQGYQNRGGYQNNNQGYRPNNGGYQNNRPQSGGGFPRKEEVIEEPYIPVAVYVDETFPSDIKDKIYNLISKLISKKITVRLNGDDREFVSRVTTLSSKYTEIYIPWKNFNEIDSKHSWNTLTATHIASTNFGAWDKISNAVKKFMARNVRMIFGDKNNSVVMALLTWSQDGANKATEVTKDTGRVSFIIKTSATYGFSVVNVGKPGAENILEKHFNL